LEAKKIRKKYKFNKNTKYYEKIIKKPKPKPKANKNTKK